MGQVLVLEQISPEIRIAKSGQYTKTPFSKLASSFIFWYKKLWKTKNVSLDFLELQGYYFRFKLTS